MTSPLPTAGKTGEELHAAIMNLRMPIDPRIPSDAPRLLAYKLGHRDARHAAAELVIAASSARSEEMEAFRAVIYLAQHEIENLSEREQAVIDAARSALSKATGSL